MNKVMNNRVYDNLVKYIDATLDLDARSVERIVKGAIRAIDMEPPQEGIFPYITPNEWKAEWRNGKWEIFAENCHVCTIHTDHWDTTLIKQAPMLIHMLYAVMNLGVIPPGALYNEVYNALSWSGLQLPIEWAFHLDNDNEHHIDAFADALEKAIEHEETCF